MPTRRRDFGRALTAIVLCGLLGAWALTLVVSEPLTPLVLGSILGMSLGMGVAAGAGWLPHR
jgi:hypothetical protein